MVRKRIGIALRDETHHESVAANVERATQGPHLIVSNDV